MDQAAPDTPATDDDTRDEAGRFLPGRTGNPRGRPVTAASCPSR